MSCEELELSILRSMGKVTTQKTIAKELGYSVGKINYVLKALADKGLLKIENFYNNKNKLQYNYLLTEEGLEEKVNLTKKFIARKKKEYEELQVELDIKLEQVWNILITGGAGYIGSHTLIELHNAGYSFVVYDNLCNSCEESLSRVSKIISKDIIFEQGDIRDKKALEKVFEKYDIDSVIHFAGLKAVCRKPIIILWQ